jgi:hypothetical protein
MKRIIYCEVLKRNVYYQVGKVTVDTRRFDTWRLLCFVVTGSNKVLVIGDSIMDIRLWDGADAQQ